MLVVSSVSGSTIPQSAARAHAGGNLTAVPAVGGLGGGSPGLRGQGFAFFLESTFKDQINPKRRTALPLIGDRRNWGLLRTGRCARLSAADSRGLAAAAPGLLTLRLLVAAASATKHWQGTHKRKARPRTHRDPRAYLIRTGT